MKNIILKLIVIGLIFSSNHLLAKSEAQTYQAWNEKILLFEQTFQQGYYADVKLNCNKLIKQISGHKYGQNYYIARLKLLSLSADYASNKFNNLQIELDSVNALISRIPKDSVNSSIKAKIALIDYFLLSSYFGKAEQLSQDLLNTINISTNRSYVNLVKYRLGRAYLGNGKNVEALAILSELQDIFNSLVSNNKVDEVGNPLKKAVSSNELKKRKLMFASLMNSKVEAYLNQGDYSNMEVLFINDLNWIKRNLGTKNEAYREYCRLRAEALLVNEKHSEAANFFYKAYKVGGVRKATAVKLEMNEKMVTEYVYLNKKAKIKKYNRRLQLTSKRAFGRKNFYYHGKDLTDIIRFVEKGNNTKAKSKFLDLLSELPEIQYHPKKMQYLEVLYEVFLRNGDVKEAKNTIDEMLDIAKVMNGESSPAYHKVKLLQAAYYIKYGNDFKIVEDVYKESFLKVVQPQIVNTNIDQVSYLNTFIELYSSTDRFNEALKLSEKALVASEARFGKNNIDYAYESEIQAELYLSKGEYVKADTILTKALKIAKNNSTSNPKVVKTYQGVAKLYSTLGYYDEARSILNKAYTSAKKYIDKQALDVVETADELAELYFKTGSFNDAEDILVKAIQLKESRLGKHNRSLINSFNLLGKVMLATGNYSEAEKNIRAGQQIALKVYADTSLKATESLMLLEELYVAIGDFTKAELNLKQVLKNQKAILGSKHISVANSMTKLALVKLRQPKRNITEIESILTEATQIIKERLGDKNPIYADQLKDIANFYYEIKQYDKADTLLGVANEFWINKLSKYNIHSAEIYLIRGDINTNKGLYDKAEMNYEKSRNIYENIFSNTHPDYVNATSKLARIYYIKNENKKSLDLLEETTKSYLDFTKKYFPSLSFREKNKYWNKIKDDFEFYNSLVMKMKGDKPSLIADIYNNTIATKALLLSSSIKVKERIMSSNDTTLISKYKRYIAQKEFITSVISMSPQQQKELGIDPKSIEKEIETLEKELSEKSEDFANNDTKESINWKDVKNTLKENEYAIEMVRFRYFNKSFTDSIVYAALIVSQETKSQPDLVIIPNGKMLENRQIKYYRNCIKINKEDNLSYNLFWKPVKTKLPDNATIYLSSEGVYNQLNVEMLRVDNEKYSFDQNNFVLVSNTKDLVLNELSTKSKKKNKKSEVSELGDIVVCGNPRFYVADTSKSGDGHRFVQLSGAEDEINQITKTFQASGLKVMKLQGRQVTEDTIKKLKNPRIFHIATHAYFKDGVEIDEAESEYKSNPLLNSGLLLKGGGDIIENESEKNVNAKSGVLTALEASNLYFDNTELVVLSACETGLGQVQVGEGVYGLQRSFLVAGANSIVMSLFKVNDEVTNKLMDIFYQKWIKTGNRRQAFYEAKKEIKKLYPNVPAFWGSFVMIGV